jgi:hypothetical protein
MLVNFQSMNSNNGSMTPRDFVYWLNGYLEVSKAETMTMEQVKMVREHLALVMQNRSIGFLDHMDHPASC